MKEELILLVDRSLSTEKTSEGFQRVVGSIIEKQRQKNPMTLVTVCLFNEELKKIHVRKTIDFVGDIAISPKGNSMLLKSFVELIDEMGKIYSSLEYSQQPEKVHFIVIASNDENIFFDLDLREKIKIQREKYFWDFIVCVPKKEFSPFSKIVFYDFENGLNGGELEEAVFNSMD